MVARGSRKLCLEPGDNSVELEIDVPDARLWDIDSPELYQCDVTLSDGTTLLLLKSPESWMQFLNSAAGIGYESNFTVGTDWVGGVHLVNDHPVLSGLPVNTAMNWPYQELVKDGNSRLGFKIADERFIAGAYRSWPFHLGTAMGEAPCGKGQVLYTTLRLCEPLLSPEPAAEPARKLFGNIIRWAASPQ